LPFAAAEEAARWVAASGVCRKARPAGKHGNGGISYSLTAWTPNRSAIEIGDHVALEFLHNRLICRVILADAIGLNPCQGRTYDKQTCKTSLDNNTVLHGIIRQ
jgi:hypothetical protein